MTPVSFTVSTPDVPPVICKTALVACSLAQNLLRDGAPVTLRTTFRQDTPLGPVFRVVTARY